MPGILDRGKYKIIEVLYSDADFEACLCSDVTCNDGYTVWLFNVYKGTAVIREYLPIYYKLPAGRGGFRELITSEGAVSAVFTYHKGKPFSVFFASHSKEKFDEKLSLADSMFKNALEFDIADARIAVRALAEENVVVDEGSLTVCFNYLVKPAKPEEDNFCSRRLGQMLGEIFRPDRYLPAEITEFTAALKAGRYRTCADIYSEWRRVKASAPATRGLYLSENMIQYIFRRLKIKKKSR